MHIDHSKLIELLTEASGMEKDKVEAHLAELSEEIADAVSEGDAYEVDGLGVFSGIGNNIIFIPAEDFATEINYKYVGMEPIEIEGSAKDVDTEESPDKPEEISPEDEGEDDPFAGLLDEGEEEVATGSSFVMDLLNEEENDYEDAGSEEELEPEADEEPVENAEDEPPFELDALEAEEDSEQEEKNDTSDEEEAKPGPDKWGIDTYKDDTDAGMFSGLLGDKKEDAEPEGDSDKGDDDDLSSIFDDSDEDSDDALANELSKQLEDEDSDPEDTNIDDIFGSESDVQDEEDDFEDPFESLAEDDDEPKESKEEDEVVPVITNLASESAKKKRKEKEVQDEDESKADESSETPMRPPASRDHKGQPVILWVLLIVVLFAGGTYGLGYFGVIDIPGITPETQTASTPSPPNQVQTPPPEETPANESSTEEDSEQTPVADEQTTPPDNPVSDTQEPEEAIKEQPAEALVSQNSDVPNDQPMYGLKGVTNPEANSGYTLVIYSLSDEGNARNKITELNNDGYRALLASVPSQQYGQLWRVSLGQFESLRTAALAAETLEAPFSENYFITKIK